MEVSFLPQSRDIDYIKQWLLQEDKKTGEGFYCNWNLILSSYRKGNLATISINEKPIGFVTWLEYEKTATINIIEISPKFRTRGLGRNLIDTLSDRLKENSICVIDLQCAPASSELVWKKMNYCEFPYGLIKNPERYKRLYRILVPPLKRTYQNSGEIIELWNNEPHLTTNIDSSWKWKVRLKSGTSELVNPIIHPAHSDWRIRWKSRSKVYKDTKVKYFCKEKIYFNKFIILNKLPEK